MLLLTREEEEEIIVISNGHEMVIKVVEVKGDKVSLGFEADRNQFVILRKEVRNQNRPSALAGS